MYYLIIWSTQNCVYFSAFSFYTVYYARIVPSQKANIKYLPNFVLLKKSKYSKMCFCLHSVSGWLVVHKFWYVQYSLTFELFRSNFFFFSCIYLFTFYSLCSVLYIICNAIFFILYGSLHVIWYDDTVCIGSRQLCCNNKLCIICYRVDVYKHVIRIIRIIPIPVLDTFGPPKTSFWPLFIYLLFIFFTLSRLIYLPYFCLVSGVKLKP